MQKYNYKINYWQLSTVSHNSDIICFYWNIPIFTNYLYLWKHRTDAFETGHAVTKQMLNNNNNNNNNNNIICL
jgi:hypothetical protein